MMESSSNTMASSLLRSQGEGNPSIRTEEYGSDVAALKEVLEHLRTLANPDKMAMLYLTGQARTISSACPIRPYSPTFRRWSQPPQALG